MWLNDYHSLCRAKTGAYLQSKGKTEAFDWLTNRTEPVVIDEPNETTPQAVIDPGDNAASFNTAPYSFMILAICAFL